MVKFGVDVGGTTIKIGLFSMDGDLIEKEEIVTDKSDHGSHILDDIAQALDRILSAHHLSGLDCAGVGMGLPGPVTEKGEVLGCVNLGWGTFSVEEEFSKKFHNLPVKAGNDANVAALGELRYGAGKGSRNMVMITLGTGVGGGIISGGRIIMGANGAGGEIGHMPVEESEEEICSCGKRGCLEQYASATGIVRMARKMGFSSSKLDFTAKDVFDAAKKGDETALDAVECLGKYLGIAMASVASVVNPDCMVLGGGVSKAGDILVHTVEKHFQTRVFRPCSNVEFRIASLGNDGGIYGAAELIDSK